MIYINILFIAISAYFFALSDTKFGKISLGVGCVVNLLAACLYIAAHQ